MASTSDQMAGLSTEEKRALIAKLLQKKAEEPEAHPLSFAQQRLWFLDQLNPGSPFYNIPGALHMSGRLDVAALARSLNEVVRRHEALRTTFSVVNGQPAQVIAPQFALPLPVTDLRNLPDDEREAEARRLIVEESQNSFDLSKGPLFRGSLIRLAEEEHILILNTHHIVSDGWSAALMVDELVSLYEAFTANKPSPLPDLPIQYADFALWQRQWLQGEVLREQLDYWKQHLGDNLPVLDLPTDRPRPPVLTFNGALYNTLVPATLGERLNELSQREGATLFMTLLAAFKVLLARYSGQRDIIVGTPIANRNRAEIEGLVGFFANTLALRTNLSGDLSFRELLKRVKGATLGGYDHQDLPFEKLVEEMKLERDASYPPVFQVMFVLQNTPTATLEVSGLTLKPLDAGTGTARFPLTVWMEETPEGYDLYFEYNTDLFDERTIKQMGEHFRELLGSAAANPDESIWRMEMMTKAERNEMLFDWNDTEKDYGHFKSVNDLFESQVERAPEAVAAMFAGDSLTYWELNKRANQLARHLRSLGVGPDVCVGISVERSLDMAVGVMGILKAGGAYVPIDPAYPKERQAFMLGDTRTPVLLTQKGLIERLGETDARVICLDDDWGEIARQEDGNLDSGVEADNLAYVVYTSGSTGKPKGVAWSHGSLANLIRWVIEDSPLKIGAKTLQYASLSFDVSAQEFFPSWCTGAALVFIQEEIRRDTERLLKFLADEEIERLFIPFVGLQQLAEAHELTGADSLNLRDVITAGEQLQSTRHIRRFFETMPDCQFHNFYGPSEGNIVTVYMLEGQPHAWPALPSIGRPITNTQVHILDENMNPAPTGVAGELYIGGVVLAQGYLNRPDLTAEKFIPNPFSRQPGTRLYKTGDLARYMPDGNMEFLGRIDHQVKIRGYRVELGEIEFVLGQHPSVQETVVMVREDVPGNKRVVAYVIADPEQPPESRELRSYLKEKLPEYMVPSEMVLLEAFPLTPSRKIDRRALPAPEINREDLQQEYIAPRTPEEEAIASTWAEILGLEKVGVQDDFFELGGHSLLATQVVSRIKENLSAQIPLRAIFAEPTVEGLAAEVMKSREGGKSEPAGIIGERKSLRSRRAKEKVGQLSSDEVNALLDGMLAKKRTGQ